MAYRKNVSRIFGFTVITGVAALSQAGTAHAGVLHHHDSGGGSSTIGVGNIIGGGGGSVIGVGNVIMGGYGDYSHDEGHKAVHDDCGCEGPEHVTENVDHDNYQDHGKPQAPEISKSNFGKGGTGAIGVGNVVDSCKPGGTAVIGVGNIITGDCNLPIIGVGNVVQAPPKVVHPVKAEKHCTCTPPKVVQPVEVPKPTPAPVVVAQPAPVIVVPPAPVVYQAPVVHEIAAPATKVKGEALAHTGINSGELALTATGLMLMGVALAGAGSRLGNRKGSAYAGKHFANASPA